VPAYWQAFQLPSAWAWWCRQPFSCL
jgi:hypothetical protein